nr:MAG TPA: hypothetical protein [Caudoviricetes sp.]
MFNYHRLTINGTPRRNPGRFLSHSFTPNYSLNSRLLFYLPHRPFFGCG